MLSLDSFTLCIIILIIGVRVEGTSVNRPKLCSSATWNASAITFANSNTVGGSSYAMFINRNNTIYVAVSQYNAIQVWTTGSSAPVTVFVRNSSNPLSLFATDGDTIYVDDNSLYVTSLQLSQPKNSSSLYTGGRCYGIFLDKNNSLYCSLNNNHMVIKRSLNSSDYQMTIVAGEGCYGFTGNKLYNPMGIFVDDDYKLYVADYQNHRIQLFQPGIANVTTAAGNGAPETITLYYPTDVMADADGYIYIADYGHYRIVGSNSHGFHCVAGCTGSSGSASNQLATPWIMAFDVYGNIFVTDTNNSRVQQFLLATNSCDATTAAYQASTPSGNTGISYNRPKLCANASWNANATTLTDSSLMGSIPTTVFVDTNNTVYVRDAYSQIIQMWFQSNITLTKNISQSSSYSYGLFVTSSGDIYSDNALRSGEVSRWTINASNAVPAMYSTQPCFGLSVDTNNILYCSLFTVNQVVARSLNDVSTSLTVVAGTGCSGSGSNQLTTPTGIFVNTNFDIYVADYGNNRIQLFHPRQSNGTTVAGAGAPGTTILNCPMDVVLDGDGYLFIVDACNNRIIGSGAAGFRCIIGCSGSSGSAPSELQRPWYIAFDSFGNIYIADIGNNRVQLFTFEDNSCAQLSSTTTTTDTSSPSTTTTTTDTSSPSTATTTTYTSSPSTTTTTDTSSPSTTTTTDTPSPSTTTTTYTSSPSTTTTTDTPSPSTTTTTDTSSSSTTTTTDTSSSSTTTTTDTSSSSTTTTTDTSSPSTTTTTDTPSPSTTTTTDTPSPSTTTTTDTPSPSTTTTTDTSSPSTTTTTDTSSPSTATTTTDTLSPSTTTTTTTSTSSLSVSLFTSNQTCFLPNITLIPSGSSLSSPLQFRRSQEFSISSYLQLDCNLSLSTIIKWTVTNCTSICSSSLTPLPQTLITTSTEFSIPAKTLTYGTYQFTLTVAMIAAPLLSSSASVYVKIIPSGITPNLIQFGTSMITRGYQQQLTLDPGSFSVDPDSLAFNATNWKYKYFCRIYPGYNFPSIAGLPLTIDDPRVDVANPSCILQRSGNTSKLQYTGPSSSPMSALTLFGNALASNQTYQFMIQLENIFNSSSQATGYLLVQVDDTQSELIVISCVISTLCTANQEYQFANPTTQVAIFSLCVGTCVSINDITWNVYYGTTNASTNLMRWTLFKQAQQYQDVWFFGSNTSNFTATNNLFLSFPAIQYWRFEVIYSFAQQSSLSAMSFKMNTPPQNGSCTIFPLNGTTSALFTITCSQWFDDDGIQDYSFYSWTTNPNERLILAYSSFSSIQLRLPSVNANASLSFHVSAQIRDTLSCVTEYNISSVTVYPDTDQITDLIDAVQQSTGTSGLANNPIIQILASGNPNAVGQVVSSLSQQFNQISTQSLQDAIANGVPVSSVAVSTLDATTQSTSPSIINASTLDEFNKQTNTYASIRDFLITFITGLQPTTAPGIQLQASSLAQLTQATNQLTRSASMIAAQKCNQLAITLYSLATMIPFEDVQSSATLIAQCASNVLNAVNGPLQERTIVLDLDSSRANAFPQDYDTDLESEWNNLNLFGDGSDQSWNSLEKSRNLYFQKQTANEVSLLTTQTMSLLTASLNIHLNIGQNLNMNTASVCLSLEITSIDALVNKSVKQTSTSQIRMPSTFQINTTNISTISLRSMIEPLASAGNASSQSRTNLSRSVSFSLLDTNGKSIPIQTTFDYPIELIIPRDPFLVIPSMSLQNVTSFNSSTVSPHQQLFNLHFVNITNPSLTVSVHFEMHPLNTSLAYLFIYRFDTVPILNTSHQQIDGWSLFCPHNLTNDTIHNYFIDNNRTKNHQSIIFGLRQLNTTEQSDQCSNASVTIQQPPANNQPFNFTSNYELRIFTSGCYYLDTNSNWQSEGVLVGPLTNHQQTQCLSTHLTTFAGGFLVLPAPINWNYVFSNADFARNKTIYITLICVSVLYFLLLVYARYKDKKDLEKLGVTPLPDNQPSDQHFYQILVFTGHRTHSGTNSKVHFILAGDDDETQVRTFADPRRKILQRGGIDAFVMTVPKSLGSLNYMHIWHDNSGKGASASWFLKYIIVRDLQTLDKSYFICQRWLAVEKDDGMIERVLPVAGEHQRQEFSYLLSKQAYHSISEGHLWFSIFSRPPSNQFTRVQRCTCCFVLLLTSMLLNILYYDQVATAKANVNTASLAFGPLHITPEQISIGVIVELLTFLPSIFLVQFFRRIEPKRLQQQLSPLRQAIYKIRPDNTIVESNRKKRSRMTFPWWCLFIAYALSFIIVAVSMFFVIVRGIEFGDVKTQKWLTSLLTGFLSSIVLIQPAKIIGLAIIFALFIRNTNKDQQAAEFIDDDNEDHPHLNNDEQYLHSLDNQSPFNHRSKTQANRLNQAELAYIRDRRLKEIQMWSIIREIFTYLTFLALLYVITYSNINQHAFYEVQHLRQFFHNSRQIDNNYIQLSTVDQYWNWLETSFVDNIRAQQWYNGDPPRNLSGFINDKSNRLIGWVAMRQLRTNLHSCQLKSSIQQQLFTHCTDDYSFSNEEKQSFQPGWIPYQQINNQSQSFGSAIEQAFIYRTSNQLDTYPTVANQHTYSGNGYVYEFRGRLADIQTNLSQLHQLQWIDGQTRAIIIQFTLYNPNAQLFTFVTLLTEFLSSGSIDPQSRFEPITFEVFTSLPQLICTIFYMLFIIHIMIGEVRSLIKMKSNYFRQFWSLINLGIIVCSWTNVGIYVWRYCESLRIGHLFAQTNGYVYINLQLAVYINDVFTYLLAFSCFFGTIKFIKLCRFNHRLMLFARTLQHAARELISFACMFTIVFMAFVVLFYLLFVSKLSSCSSVLQTVRMLFEITLMKFNTQELTDAAAFLGPFCFALFIVIVVFVCMSMFLSIINDSFRVVRDNGKLQGHDDQHIFSFIIGKLRTWIGIGNLNDFYQMEERDEQMRSKYYDPISKFPDKMDELLDALNRVYINQQDHSSLKKSEPGPT
ncbi:unnamed protein product [Adineta ricciae]|uniref:PLAT domain-containing protein n=1 Tax=Adineta ricciae TaxID=249248 RepID=A0A815EF67_ADIRI|nr:unnamed protein product [Adineta ricciae]